MKKIYQLLALITLLVSGCTQDEVVKNQDSSSKSLIYTASFEGSESRTYLNEDGYLRWTADDQISIFGANTYNQQYKFTGETGANSGTFEKVSGSYATGTDLNHHYALYPYSSQTTISETGVITATIPANQTYAVNSFGLGANTMVAVTKDEDDTFLKFKNVGGYLELKLYGDDVTVKSIKLEGNSDEKLAGNATITAIYGQDPTISMANDATKTITMDCGDSGVQLGTAAETATTFLLVVPPTTFASGFTITVTDINGSEFTKSTSKSIEIKRNIIQPMNAFEVEYMNWFNPNQYITYVKNHEWVYVGSKNYYQYSSKIDCPVNNFSKIEFKFKLTDSFLSHYTYLCTKNIEADKTSSIYLKNDYGLVIENKHWDDWEEEWILYSSVRYSWDELNVEKTDCMTLITSFKDKYIKLNNVDLEYKISQYTNFDATYLFTYYTHENDEGIWCVLGEGVPEGSKLYYVKIWDENDNLVYLGAASKELNPKTNNEEYCWKSYCNGEYNYEFAYYPTTHSDYTPYGGGID